MVLYLVAVPIGNLSDITLRAIDTLKEVDFIIAEDTRYSMKLLNHLGIKKGIISYYRPMEARKAAEILEKLKSGNGALITDSGTPLISDPGYILVREALNNGIDIIPLPGPTAFVPALIASGIDPRTFLFLGFPPRKKGELISFLKKVADLRHTLVFYESPRRTRSFLLTAASVLGDRNFCLGKEISKKHEKIIRGRLGSLDTLLESEILRGELVVVIEGAEGDQPDSEAPVIRTREDIFAHFKDRFGISKNSVKKALMKK